MNEPGLKRDIGPIGSSLLSFNGIVGAGIFALPATLHLQFGAFRRSGLAVALLMAGGILVCLWVAAQSEARSWLMLAGLVAVGLLLYALAARGRSSSRAADEVSAIVPPPSSRDPS